MGRRGIILIPKGRAGWGWHKFSGELRKALDFLYATVGCGSGSSDVTVKQGGKEEGERLGLTCERMGPSFAAVVKSGSDPVAKVMPILGGRHPWLRAPFAEPCALDLFPVLRIVDSEALRSAVDCFVLEMRQVPPFDSLDMGKSPCPLGKQQIEASFST